MATTDKFASEISKILEQYKDDIVKDTDTLVKKMGQKGAKELKSASGIFGGTGDYAKGWKSKVTKSRFGATATIYNEKPGLPHLLENGHAKRGGGRVAGRTHIAPVEQKLIEEFEKAVKEAI